jgi:hypothetical protein
MNSYANLYRCSEADGKPELIAADEPVAKMGVDRTEAHWVQGAQEHVIHSQNKIPFLIYYAVDSAEPFMQLSTKYEVAQLEKNCKASSNVNFAALLNSLYLETNEIIVCKDQSLQKINLTQFPDLDFKLKRKLKSIGEDDHTTSDFGPMSFQVRYKANINKPFLLFPLAHPDFLYDLVELLITEERFFPTEKYLPFLNLKAHGLSAQGMAAD